jgi:transposase InsO family protein
MIQAVMTDNGVGYTSRIFADTLESVGIDHVTTRPYRPQTNGKVERFQRTLATEWAYATTWTSDKQRGEALNDWIHQYNHHRYHTASTAHSSAASTTSGINTTRFASWNLNRPGLSGDS